MAGAYVWPTGGEQPCPRQDDLVVYSSCWISQKTSPTEPVPMP
ncbi:hypothetical protein [Streptomyces anulatus]